MRPAAPDHEPAYIWAIVFSIVDLHIYDIPSLQAVHPLMVVPVFYRDDPALIELAEKVFSLLIYKKQNYFAVSLPYFLWKKDQMKEEKKHDNGKSFDTKRI